MLPLPLMGRCPDLTGLTIRARPRGPDGRSDADAGGGGASMPMQGSGVRFAEDSWHTGG